MCQLPGLRAALRKQEEILDMSSEPGMEELHGEMLLLLKAFHKLCVENNIKYSLHAGTLLGAIREKGFIPWDDDVDVMLTRDEYTKLMQILDRRAKEYNVSAHRVRKSTWLIPTGKTKLPIMLDLLVYDYISECKQAQKCKIGLLMMLTAMLHTKQSITTTFAADYSGMIQICFYTAYFLGKLFPNSLKTKLFDWISQNAFCGNKTMIHRSNDIYSYMRPVYPNDMMSEFMLTDFEGTEIMITKRYHEVLTSLYGEDYMTPKRMTAVHKDAHEAVRRLCGDLKSQ